MSNLSYIPNAFARGYVASREDTRKGVHVPLSFIDICNGNMYDAILFSQIMYWHEPSKETGKTRLTKEDDGHLWLYKNHSDWYKECRIKSATVRKCLARLRELDLIIYKVGGAEGNATPFIRINWDTFESRMKISSDEKKVERKAKKSPSMPDTTGQPPVTTYHGSLIQQDNPLLQRIDSNTENTTENTTKNTLKDSSPSVEDAPQQAVEEIKPPETTTTEHPKISVLSKANKPDVKVQSQESDTVLVQENESVALVVPTKVLPKLDAVDAAEEHVENILKLNPESPYTYKDWQLVISKIMNYSLETRQGCQMVSQHIKFFKGECNFKSKKSDFNLYQCNGEIGGDGLENVTPMTLVQIVGLTLYYRAWKEPYDKIKQAQTYLPRTKKTLQERCRDFLASPDYEKLMATAKPKLETLLNGATDNALDTTQMPEQDYDYSTPAPRPIVPKLSPEEAKAFRAKLEAIR